MTLLDAALDADRAAAADAEAKGYFEGLREGAIEAACGRLGSDLQRAWRDRVRLLLARLDAQRVDGPPVGGDAPQPSDDVMGDPVEVPVPTRFRHVLASMLWARYEAVRAFEMDTAAAVPASQAYRLAVAVSGLHFALGLAERASAGPVREVAELLDAEEHRILRYRNARRTADLLAEAGRPAPVVEAGTSVQEAWQALVAPAFRARLAEVAAQV